MFYELDIWWAEDDGSAWRYDDSHTPFQVGPLGVDLLEDGHRVVGVSSEVLVDQDLANELRALLGDTDSHWPLANVRGPQPKSLPRPPMVQLAPARTCPLAEVSKVRGPDGNVVSLKAPFVLDAAAVPPGGRRRLPGICRIAENRSVIFSREVKELFLAREPHLFIRAVRFEDEDEADDAIPRPPSTPFSLADAIAMKAKWVK